MYSNINTVMSISGYGIYTLYLITGICSADSGIMCKCAPSVVDVSVVFKRNMDMRLD